MAIVTDPPVETASPATIARHRIDGVARPDPAATSSDAMADIRVFFGGNPKTKAKPHPEGEWVRWEDVEAFLAAREISIEDLGA